MSEPARNSPWTPERVIAEQSMTIAYWREKAKSAERMRDALQAYGGSVLWLYRVARAVVDQVAREREALAFIALDLIAGVALTESMLAAIESAIQPTTTPRYRRNPIPIAAISPTPPVVASRPSDTGDPKSQRPAPTQAAALETSTAREAKNA